MPLRIKDVSLYTARDVAYRLGIAEGTVRKYLREGKLIGRKHAGAWHVTEESFRAFLRNQGDDLTEDDIPQIVIQIPIHHEADGTEIELNETDLEQDEEDAAEHFPQSTPPGMDEVKWLILEARRLKVRARRLEDLYAGEDEAE
jgi:predicted transcriptional regulator